MKIAFIMLCHKNPEQINLLIGKLSEFDGADIYIHVDMNHADIRDCIVKKENVRLISENKSYHIHWGSVDIVKATLQLIREVKNTGNRYDYIWLVSGQDYPICSTAEIERKLSENLGMNYIETIVQGDVQYNRYRKLYELPYPAWINKNTLAVKSIKRVYMILTGGYYHTFSLFVRKKPFDFDYAFGSQWWTLTTDAAYEILEYSDQHPEILIYYKKSIIPDESFFQTMFMRGQYRNQRRMNLTYINWGKSRRSPMIFTLDDLEMLREKSKTFCFARKFELPQSSAIIKILS